MSGPTLFQRAARWAAGLADPVPAQPAAGAQVRRFEAARLDRLTSDWLATNASINHELQSDLDRLRARGRQLVNNNDYARKFRGMVENNIVGPAGVRLQARVEDGPGRPDRLANIAVEQAWAEWGAACDVTGQMSLRDLCEALVGALPSDGEFLVRLVKGADAGNRFNLALQVIDVDRIDTAFNGSWGGNTVIMGVEVNAWRRPVALHLFAAHPSDGARSSRQRIRVPADELLHRFKVERAEQVRGIPWMAPGMLSLHHLGGFMLSAVLAAEHGANHYGFFTTPDGVPPPIGGAQAGGQGDGAEQITTSQPGTFDTLPTGYGFTPFDSKYPNEVFAPFVKTALQRVATGWRVAYHSLANDLEGVNFSSIRSGTLEERDRWSADQSWFIGAFLEPVYRAWLQMALLSGAIAMPGGSKLPASKLDKFARHEWQPRRWDWVDPRADMESRVLGIRAGLLNPYDVAAAMGGDFADNIDLIKQAYTEATTAPGPVPWLTAYEGKAAPTSADPGADPGADTGAGKPAAAAK